MYLKKLELQGFKSFADKTVLEFKPGITAVIGPNGSGKSNVSDAIRWVLGEQSIKNLRGSKLEDVIFAGTQARRPVSFAEVTITLDNTDGRLPLDYTEVTVTRRIYRSGESEFFINKNQCRLKDIVELFMDTGIGRDGYSIIGQGRIDEILSTKSEDRRNIFEDAAGIVKYRSRKEEAEKKLEDTNQNLLRINDIVAELEAQLEPLRIQSEKAKKYLDYKNSLRTLEVGLLISNINKNKQKLAEITEQLDQITAQENDENKNLEELQNLKDQTRAAIDSITEQIEKIQSQIFEEQNNIEKQKSDTKVKEAKIEHNTQTIETSKQEIEDLKAKNDELKNEIEDRKRRQERLATDKKRFTDELAQKEAELEKLSTTLSADAKHIEELKASIMQNIDLKFEKLETLKNLSANFESAKSRVKQIDSEIFDNKLLVDKERMKKSEQDKVLKEVTKTKLDLETKINDSKRIRAEYDGKVSNYESQIRAALYEINNKESRLKFLEETENEFEGYNNAVKAVMQRTTKDSNFANGIYGTVASVLNVPKEYETAIEMTLMGSLQNIITSDENKAKEAIEFLKSNNLGRASFYPITSVKGDKLRVNLKNTNGCKGIAADLVSFDSKYEGIINSILGKVVIVDTIDNAVEIAKANRYSFKIVTLDGDIINPSGQMSGGSVAKKTTSILSRGREIEELKKLVEELKASKANLEKEYEEYKQNAESILKAGDEVIDSYQVAQVNFATEAGKMNEINNNIDRITKKNESLDAEKQKISVEQDEKQKEIDSLNALLTKCDTENETWQTEVDEFAKKNMEQQKVFDDLNSDIMDLKISVSSFDESNSSIEEVLARINDEITENTNGINKKNDSIEKLTAENTKLADEISGVADACSKIDEHIKELSQSMQDSKDDRQNKNASLTTIEGDIESKFKTIEVLHDQSSKLDARKQKAEQDNEDLINKMWDEYQTTPNTAKDYAEVTPNTSKEVEELKSKIKSLGEVNVNSIDEYAAVGDRYEFLRKQKEDLENSKASLEKIISDMLELMRIQFAQKFELINKNFGEIFTQLFGGGKAELILSDTNNILESGIEIVVQPPGKKLQNMMLLSGGERAFTAIAILFAILKLSPAPFCILDEIEAALDDVNVYRYADYLKKFCGGTQFLVITHRKGTMEAANTVYGATMQEHGITKLVSMKLDEN